MPGSTAVRVPSLGVLVVALATAAVTTACGSGSAPTDTSAPPQAVKPAATVRTVADPRRQAVMEAYAGYLAAETTASQKADFGSTELPRYMGQPLLGQWVSQLYHLHAIGYKQLGSVVSASPWLTSITFSAGRSTGTAIVTDCLDENAMTIVNATTGRQMELPRHNSRYLTKATLHLENGFWRVYEVDADRSKTC